MESGLAPFAGDWSDQRRRMSDEEVAEAYEKNEKMPPRVRGGTETVF